MSNVAPFPSGTQDPFAHLDPVRRQLAIDKARQMLQDAAARREQALLALPSIELELQRRVLKADFSRRFVETFWHVIEPDQALRWNWHLDAMLEELNICFHTPDYKGVFNIPPGTMKSLTLVMYRAWLWAVNPALRFLTGSYSAHLSIRDNVKLRTVVQSPLYKKLFPDVELTGEQNQKEKFETKEGGWSYATSVGGGGTGEHPDYVFIDDPITAQQARSLVEMTSANDWIDRTLSTRGVVRDRRAILVMQRLHMSDATQHVLDKGWKHLYFPMRFISQQRDAQHTITYTPHPKDPRVHTGVSLLWPELFTEQKVKQLEIDLGPYGAAGQLQQRPTPEGGGLFRREWFQFVDAAPVFARRCRGWDTGATEGGGDATVGTKIAEAGGKFYIEDCTAVHLGPGGVDSHIRSTAELDGRSCLIAEEREPGSAGKTVIDIRLQRLVGYDYVGMPTSGDKVTRANPFRAQCEGGNVFLVRGPWNEAYLQELEFFPMSAKDNRVDSTSCAFNRLVLAPKKRGVMWGSKA